MQESKYRSLKAFKKYEEKKSEVVSPLRVMALLRQKDEALRKGEIAAELDADLKAVDRAVAELVEAEVVKVRRGEEIADDLVEM